MFACLCRSDSMRALVLFVCLSVGCLAQRPQQCTSPPLLTGSLSVSTQNEKLMAFAKYSYDALGERIRLREYGSYNNKTFHLDVLLLYRQGVLYKINYRNRTCCKKPLSADFHPLAIPQGASLLAQVVLGSSSGPGQGVLVNTWAGELQTEKGKVPAPVSHAGEPARLVLPPHLRSTSVSAAQYMSTVTEFGCVPVSTLFHTNESSWVVTSFFNNVLGLVDPEQLIPPLFCKGAQLQNEDPVTFFSLF